MLGKLVTLDGVGYTIVGVLPRGFHFYGDAEVYTPLGQGDSLMLNPRGGYGCFAIARLKPGVAIAQAEAEMSTIQKRLEQLYPDANQGMGTEVVPLKQQMVGDMGGTLLLLLGAVGLVLLIACSNIANMMLARGSARAPEIALRLALGATRGQIVRLLLVEGVVLATIGGSLRKLGGRTGPVVNEGPSLVLTARWRQKSGPFKEFEDLREAGASMSIVRCS